MRKCQTLTLALNPPRTDPPRVAGRPQITIPASTFAYLASILMEDNTYGDYDPRFHAEIAVEASVRSDQEVP